MPPPSKKVEYKQAQFEERVPFVIFADFESLMITKEPEVHHDDANSDDDDDGDDERPTAPKTPRGGEDNAVATNQHSKTTVQFERKAISVGVKLVSSVPGVLDDLPYETYTGEDPADWLLEKLIEYETKCTDFLFDQAKIRMTAVEHVLFAGATHTSHSQNRLFAKAIRSKGATIC